MKFSCTQENLKHGLLLVSRVASRNTNLPILQNILIKAETNQIILAATNLEIGVEVQLRGRVDEAGSFTVPAQLITNYISLLATDRVDCVLVNNELQISANGQATVLKGESATDFPIVPTVEGASKYDVAKVDLELALQQTVVAAAIDESRPEIAGVCFKVEGQKLTLVATDSYRLAERTMDLKAGSGDTKVILPQRSAHELLRLLQASQVEIVSVLIQDNQLACHFSDVAFISRLVEGKFLDYEQIIPKTGSTTSELSKADFVKAVKGAALFSKTGVNDIYLLFSKTEQTVQIKATNIQLGQNVTTLPAKVEGDDVDITFNYRFLLDGVQTMVGETVQFIANGKVSPGLFRSSQDERFVYVIMPIKQ